MVNDPRRLLWQLELNSDDEKDELLFRFNQPHVTFSCRETLHGLFEEQVAKTPDNVAVIYDGLPVTYRRLNDGAHRLAGLLVQRGVAVNSVLAVMADDPVRMVTGILAALKVGCAYLPVDPALPANRISYMLRDSNAVYLLTDATLSGAFISGVQTIAVGDADKEEEDDQTVMLLLPDVDPGSVAYIIYTSGTTGRPKGVAVQHHSVVNTLISRRDAYRLDERMITIQLFSYAFDGFVTGFFNPITCGGRAVLFDMAGLKDIRRLSDSISFHRVTHLLCLPVMFRNLLDHLDEVRAASLRVISLAGDTPPRNLIDDALELNPKLEIVNEYGVTEAAVMSTMFRHQEKHSAICIGVPTANVRIFILDNRSRLAPVGVPGELCIAGEGVARGYINRPQLTAETFIDFPLPVNGANVAAQSLPGGPVTPVPIPTPRTIRLYRSGDLARWLSDGTIQFIGRIDTQVKIRGFRIELGEIETRILAIPQVRETVVVDRENPGGEKYLVAYMAPVTGSEISIKQIRGSLAGQLPDYMIPSHFVILHQLPLGPTGKIDRKALPDPSRQMEKDNEYVAPETQSQNAIIQVWETILAAESIGIHDNFFQLGGDSIKAICVLNLLQRSFHVSLEDLFQYQTAEQLADRIVYKESGLRRQLEAMQKGGHGKAGQPGVPENDELVRTHLTPELERYRREIRSCLIHDLSQRIPFEHILLTGAAGYAGIYLLRQLLVATNAVIYPVVAALNDEAAQKRVENKLEYYFGPHFLHEYKERIRVLAGDITVDFLGWSSRRYLDMSNTIDVILNAADYYKSFGRYKEFKAINIDAVRLLIDFAMIGRKKILNHISTLPIAGREIESREWALFTEYHYGIGVRSERFYIQTRMEAEKMILDARSAGLNANIFRVGNLVFDSATGRFQDNIQDNPTYIVVRAMIQLAVMLDRKGPVIDFSFVDHAAAAIVSLFDRAYLQGHTFHVCNAQSVGLDRFAAMFRENGVPVESVDHSEFIRRLLAMNEDADLRNYVEDLIWHANLWEGESGPRRIILSEKTDRILEALGFHWPKLNPQHVDKMLKHCREIGCFDK